MHKTHIFEQKKDPEFFSPTYPPFFLDSYRIQTIFFSRPSHRWAFTLSMLRLFSWKSARRKDYGKQTKPCHVGIHWRALVEYSQMSTHVPGFRSFFRGFASFGIGQISQQQHKGLPQAPFGHKDPWKLHLRKPKYLGRFLVCFFLKENFTFNPSNAEATFALLKMMKNQSGLEITLHLQHAHIEFKKWIL